MKNLVLIKYLQSLYPTFKVKAEYSTNNNDDEVIVVQEQAGQKVVFYGDIDPLFNYYEIVIYGKSIKEMKTMSTELGDLIGKHIIMDYQNNGTNEKWQIIFKQYSNPQAIEYMDIRRVGYSMVFQCIVNRVA
ncbi:MAG: hypothetical protein IKE89_03415 [Bacilli bacterium]|nr:hypothetical protein [Bacilli bacterium]